MNPYEKTILLKLFSNNANSNNSFPKIDRIFDLSDQEFTFMTTQCVKKDLIKEYSHKDPEYIYGAPISTYEVLVKYATVASD